MSKTYINIHETAGINRFREPVTCGIPFPRGMLYQKDSIFLCDETSQSCPVQTHPLAFWPDQSVKWLLLDTQVEIKRNESKNYQLARALKQENSNDGILVIKDDTVWIVNTGSTLFHLDTQQFTPFRKVQTQSSEIVDGVGSGFELTDDRGMVYIPVILEMKTDVTGHLRTSIKVEGKFQNKQGVSRTDFIARLHFYRQKSFVKIDFTLVNSRPAKHPGGLWDLGDPGSVLFDDLTLKVKLAKSSYTRVEYSHDAAMPMSISKKQDLLIYQDSSGGENWQSTNHINRNGKVVHKFRGFEVRNGNKVISHGHRANPLIFMGNEHIGISATIYKFWQNFPKALQAQEDCLNIRLFPKQFGDVHELQGGEQKTHTIYLDFSNRPNALKWIHNPLVPLVKPDWYEQTKAIHYFNTTPIHRHRKYESLIETAIKGEHSFFNKRETIDEYGWRNFGEIYADHEAIGHTGKNQFISHYNNQYDLLYGCTYQFLSKSDLLWYSLMTDLAHHVIDIDIYHTTQDRDEYNGGLFWHTAHYLDAYTSTHRSASKAHLKLTDPRFCGGGPGLEHNYTTGLLLHYYLTGNIPSKETVIGLADWVMRLLHQPNRVLDTLYNFKKDFSSWKKVLSGEKIRNDKYPFTRLTGNSINALIDGYCLTDNKSYLRTVETIIRGCIHPKDDIESRDLLNAEPHWSYTVLLQAIGKYLDVKSEYGEMDEMFYYARDSLLHYAKWMLNNEHPYLDKPEILEFPNETWPAQDMRKCNVLLFASKYTNGNLQKLLVEKAQYFFEYSVNKLDSFPTKTHTRPITLLLQNGGMYAYFKKNQRETALGKKSNNGHSFCHKTEFLTTAIIFKKIIKDLYIAAQKTSLKKETKWLKFRINWP